MPSLLARGVAECLGTAFLLAAVVGSGIMAQRLAGGNDALALLCNTLPTGAILTVLILTLGPLSGAHFNPAVSLAFALRRELRWPDAGSYIAAQIIGGVIGVWVAHLMFELPVWQVSLHARTGGRAVARRIRRHVRAVADHPRMRGAQRRGNSLRGRSLYYGGLLVHRLDVVCQSGRHHRALAVRHVRRHRAGRRRRLHRRAARRHAGGRAVGPLVLDVD